MEKSISNCRVVIEPLVNIRAVCANFNGSPSKNQEKCLSQHCDKIQNVKTLSEGKDKRLLNGYKDVAQCYVKLEDIRKPLKEMNNFENVEKNRNYNNELVKNNSLRNSTIRKNSLKTTPVLKRAKADTEPITPHAHIEFSVELKKVINERNILTSKTKTHVFKALDEMKIKNEEERRSYKQQKALMEIINSEIKYVHQLETIIHFFMNPARERKLLKSEDFDTLFGNINTIYKINKELLQELDKKCDNVANAFSKIAPFLKLYSVYAYGFRNCIKVLQNSRLLNPQFAKFVENQESRPEVQNKLSALLITPIQRIPRYKLLLTNLYNLTRPSDKYFGKLSECLGKIEEAAEHINKIVEDQENIQSLLEFQRCLRSGEPNIIMPGRKLLKEGILLKMPNGGTHSERIYVVLMSDIIVFSKMKCGDLKVNSLKCLSIFPLGKCKVIELLDKGCLQIICQEEEIIVYHEQFSETKNWIREIKGAIQNHVNDRKTLKKENSSRRPVKRKDIHEYHEVGLSPGRPLKKRKFGRDMEPTAVDCNTNKNIVCSLFSPSSTPTMNTGTCERKSSAEYTENRTVVKDLDVYEKSNTNCSTFGKFLGGVGSTIKKFLGFRK